MRRRLGIIIISGALLFLSLIVTANLIFFFTEDERLRGITRPVNYVYSFKDSCEEIYLNGIDSGRVHALLFPRQNSKGVLIFFPGTHSNAEHSYQFIGDWVSHEYDLLIVEYRGCGKSTGITTEAGFYNDAQLFYDLLKTRYQEDKIVLCGFSLGGPIAAKIASENKPGKLIMIAPLYSINEKYRYRPWGYRKFSFGTYKFISRVNCPTYFFCGTEDGLYDDTYRLKVMAGPGASLFSFEKVNHLNLFLSSDFRSKLNGILDENYTRP